MTKSTRTLLLAAACCAVLSGCPRVTAVTGLVQGAAGDPLVVGERLADGAGFNVPAGGSVSIQYEDCLRTYGPGAHVASEADCDEEEEDDDDRDRDEEEDEDRDRDDRDDDHRSDQEQQEPEQSRSQDRVPEEQAPEGQPEAGNTGAESPTTTGSTPGTPAPPTGVGSPGVLDTVVGAVTSTTGTIVSTAVVGGLLHEHIEDNREGDGEPLSP